MRHTCNFRLFPLQPGRGKWVCHQTTAPFLLCNSLEIINPRWATWQLAGCRRFDVWKTVTPSPAKTEEINSEPIKCNGGGGHSNVAVNEQLDSVHTDEMRSCLNLEWMCSVVIPHHQVSSPFCGNHSSSLTQMSCFKSFLELRGQLTPPQIWSY